MWMKVLHVSKRFDESADIPLHKAGEGSVHGLITRSSDHSKFQVFCSESISRVVSIRGSMFKRVWMNEGDIVLCGLREGDNKFCEIEHKYTVAEVETIKEGGYITDQILNQEDSPNNQVDFNLL